MSIGKSKADRRFESPPLQQRVTANRRSRWLFFLPSQRSPRQSEGTVKGTLERRTRQVEQRSRLALDRANYGLRPLSGPDVAEPRENARFAPVSPSIAIGFPCPRHGGSQFSVDVAHGKGNHLPLRVCFISKGIGRRNVMPAFSHPHFSVIKTNRQEVALHC
jgi:hypothetical protein